MKLLVLIMLLSSGCSTIKPPAECEGTLRKVNPETALNTIACERGVA